MMLSCAGENWGKFVSGKSREDPWVIVSIRQFDITRPIRVAVLSAALFAALAAAADRNVFQRAACAGAVAVDPGWLCEARFRGHPGRSIRKEHRCDEARCLHHPAVRLFEKGQI